MTNLEKFLSHRIAEDEAIFYRALATTHKSGIHYMMAQRELMECDDRRWTLKFYNKVSHSGEPGASTAWETLKQVLLRMAKRWEDHPDFDPAWRSSGVDE